MSVVVDVAVVGRGLIGSAAARHLAESGVSVALIGPSEPGDRTTFAGPFASHHDHGRITRVTAADPFWARAAAASIERYGDIESRSGVRFHTPCGVACVVDDPDLWLAHGRDHGAATEMIDGRRLTEWTGIAAPDDERVVWEPGPAGVIDPLAMVAAQSRLVERSGSVVIDGVVDQPRTGVGGWTVNGSFGGVAATSVLVATGAFGAELLPRPVKLIRRPRTVLLAEIPGEVGDRLPSLIYNAPPHPEVRSIYWNPPVAYPDGRTYLKIGGDFGPDRDLTEPEVLDWFRSGGDFDEVRALREVVEALLPGVAITRTDSKPCIVTYTPNDHSYIGWVDDGLAVALAGNGAAGKSSDEVGRLAATLVGPTGWDDTYDLASFSPQYDDDGAGRLTEPEPTAGESR